MFRPYCRFLVTSSVIVLSAVTLIWAQDDRPTPGPTTTVPKLPPATEGGRGEQAQDPSDRPAQPSPDAESDRNPTVEDFQRAIQQRRRAQQRQSRPTSPQPSNRNDSALAQDGVMLNFEIKHYLIRGEGAEQQSVDVNSFASGDSPAGWRSQQTFRFPTLSENTVTLQLCEDVPIVSGRVAGFGGRGGGGFQQQYQNRSVGTLLEVESHLMDNGVRVRLRYDCSRLSEPFKPTEGDDGAEIPLQGTEQSTFQSVLSLGFDEPILIDLVASGQSKRREVLIIRVSQLGQRQQTAATRVGIEERVQRTADFFVRRLDTNGDGFINDAERGQAPAAIQRAVDLDSDGKLSREEVVVALREGIDDSFRQFRDRASDNQNASTEETDPPAESPSTSDNAKPSEGDKFLSYAEGAIEKYDRDGDQLINETEGQEVVILRGGADVDHDKDGKVSAQELAEWLRRRAAPAVSP